MHRCTLNLKPEVYTTIRYLAQWDNRSINNYIETLVERSLEADMHVDDFELGEVQADRSLHRSLRRGLVDYSQKEGKKR